MEDTTPTPTPTPEETAGQMAAAVAALEEACLEEIHAVLRRYRCELRAAPAPVDRAGQVWTFRWGVFYRPMEE